MIWLNKAIKGTILWIKHGNKKSFPTLLLITGFPWIPVLIYVAYKQMLFPIILFSVAVIGFTLAFLQEMYNYYENYR